VASTASCAAGAAPAITSTSKSGGKPRMNMTRPASIAAAASFAPIIDGGWNQGGTNASAICRVSMERSSSMMAMAALWTVSPAPLASRITAMMNDHMISTTITGSPMTLFNSFPASQKTLASFRTVISPASSEE